MSNSALVEQHNYLRFKKRKMENEKQVWLPVYEFEKLYEINELGQVRSLHRKSRNAIISPRIDRGGYLAVRLSRDGKTYTRFVHRLIGFAFVPNPDNKPFINHKDGNKTNNQIENLEWATAKENTLHAYSTGLIKTASKRVVDTCTGDIYYSVADASKALNIPYSTCKNYLNGGRPNPTCLKYAA